MRNFTLLLLGMFFTLIASGQQEKKIKCYTTESLQDFRAKHPNAQTDAQFEAWLRQKIEQRAGQRIHAYYLIPVIFHIVHNGETPGNGRNIDASQIQHQLNQLNADFANLTGSTQSAAADMEIQFCLATRDPLGNILAEPGIDRIDRNDRSWDPPPYDGFASTSYVDVTIMPESIWDPTEYFNIWTLELDGGLLGKATFPSASTIPDLPPVSNDAADHSGVFVDYNSVGSFCSPGSFGPTFGLGRTLTHEAGHFFGLRHIWGDAFCGDDFCDDTPTQDDATAGCPAPGTLNGCVPLEPKMFQNYMDYTDDPCTNTFTADQKARMQAVMANSPRRMELATAGSCAGPPANAIRFNYVCAQTVETGTGSTCPRFRDVFVNITVFGAASGAATVNFTKGGTAINDVDYTIIPASLTYVNGDALPKTITIRIWDDALVETAETIDLTIDVTGSGVVAGTGNQTFTLTITDDDVSPVIDNSGSVTHFTEDFGIAGGAFPPGWVTGFFGPTTINEWVVSSNGGAGITGQAAHITNAPGPKTLTYDFDTETNAVAVTPQISTVGYTQARLSFKYKCEGEIDAGTVYDYGSLVYSFDFSSFFPVLDPSGNPYVFQGSAAATTVTNLVLPPELVNTNFFLGFLWSNDDNTGTNPPFLIDDIVVSSPTTQVESQLTNPGTENIFNGQDVFILSDNDEQVVTKIQNATTDLGCVTAAVTQTGTARINITTDTGLFLRSEKVVSVTTSPANTTASYDITLYFTTAELAAWGPDPVDLDGIQILKVNDGVNLTSTMITGQNGQLAAAIVDDQRTTAGYASFTASFVGGFSQFMIIEPDATLPIVLINFEAKPVRRSIVLNWSTSQEINNKGFAIERSTDGANFVKIGWVDGAINSNNRTDYQYTDVFVQPGVMYYYRLRQTDIDDKQKLSPVRQAKINESGVILTLNPNPATGEVKVFIAGTTAQAQVSLVNMQGQTVRRWAKVATPNTPLALNINGLASGLYLLEVQLPNEKLVEKLMVR